MVTSTVMDRVYQFNGLSSDTKPTEGIDNGSIFVEMDTSKVYMFDYASKSWIELK